MRETESDIESQRWEILAQIQARAELTERQRQVSADSLRELRQWGLFRSFVPARYSGSEEAVDRVFEKLVDVSQACCATGWVASLFVVHSLIAAWFPLEGQAEVWAEGPDTLVGSSLAPMGEAENVPGGVRLRGRWSFSSGIDHAQWLIVGAKRENGVILLLVPASAAILEDDWQVAGLCGTGSKSFSIAELHVPEARILAMAEVESGHTPGAASHPGAIFHLPWRPLFSYAFVPPALGVAQAAVRESRAYFQTKTSVFTGVPFKDRAVGWIELAKAVGEVDTGLALMRRDLAELYRDAAAAQASPPQVVHRASFTPALIVRYCRDAVMRLFSSSGGAVMYSATPLQRHMRDVLAVAQHPAVNFDFAAERYGKAVLDFPD